MYHTAKFRAEFYTGDNDAKMRYTPKTFRAEVFFRYGVKLVGWPPHIPFRNLSGRGAPSMADLRELLNLAHCGILHFELTTDEELDAAHHDLAKAMPGPLFPTALRQAPQNLRIIKLDISRG